MHELEQLLGLFLAAVILAAAARHVGAPYPVFLAIGGALLALRPGMPGLTLPPELVLALFVAPVLLDAAYDTSLRDLRDNWAPVMSLVVFAVALTTAAVAVVVHALVPQIPWAAAIALGAVVAPPDAVAAAAVLRPLRPPQRLLTILEGESMLNDASALLIYRVAVGAAASGFSMSDVAPTFLYAVVGSLIAGPALGWIVVRVMERLQHVPTAIIVQFLVAFGVWIFAERAGLSGVLTTVCFAITLARTSPARTPARVRVPTYAVWETAVFGLNIFAFIFIGLQIRPIFESLEAADRLRYVVIAAAVLATVIAVRLVWHMSFNAVIRLRQARTGFNPPRPMLRPSIGSGLVISWAGMRGIVSLAAALALPEAFPFRDLIVFIAFAIVLGTLAIQGLTLKPLLRALDLRDDDPVGHEVSLARERALRAALATLEGIDSPVANIVRQEFLVHLGTDASAADPAGGTHAEHIDVHRKALMAAREAVLTLRAREEIGDDAFHRVEEDLDWLEMASGVGET